MGRNITLSKLNITNGEGALLAELIDFINFMKTMSTPIPETRSRLNSLLAKYIQAKRKEQMIYISNL